MPFPCTVRGRVQQDSGSVWLRELAAAALGRFLGGQPPGAGAGDVGHGHRLGLLV